MNEILEFKSINLQIKNLTINNFKVYEDVFFDFTELNNPKKFICFIGENGSGKTTLLNIIQMLFSRYEGYSEERIDLNFNKYIRNENRLVDIDVSDCNFLIKADIYCSLGDYSISFDRKGFIEDHPQELKNLLYRLCYTTRFDKELDQFQLKKDQWLKFKGLFESVTGYQIFESKNVFSYSEDSICQNIMSDYIIDFYVKKPHETIRHRDCSNGEKKIIKSFSTLLNLDYLPKLILIDDIAMHVSLNRHMKLIEKMQDCYPDSQIFSTAHSYRMSKDLSKRNMIYDLRTIRSNDLIKLEPWRLQLIDEIQDAWYKLEGLTNRDSKIYKLINQCDYFIQEIRENKNVLINEKDNICKLLKEVSDLYIIGITS